MVKGDLMYKVLIVDDMEIARIQLKRVKLWGENSGFQITEEAKNGHEAYIKLQDSTVDLIITDIRMPILDGVELLEKVMTKKLAHCVVLLSEYSEFEYARKGLVLGAFDYLVKPINENELSKLLVRAKDFIEEKKLKKNQVTDFKQILELIKYGKQTERITALVFDKITDSESDILRTAMLIRKLHQEAIELIGVDMPWLKKFVDSNFFEVKGIYNITCLEKLKEIFITNIRKLSDEINTIYFGRHYGDLINQISTFVVENIDNEINLSIIANNFFINKNYLSEVFKKKTNMSLLDYITKTKMERGKKLLAEGELRSYEIADKLGYKDAEYFSKLFKKYSGMSPKEYKNLQINIKADKN